MRPAYFIFCSSIFSFILFLGAACTFPVFPFFAAEETPRLRSSTTSCGVYLSLLGAPSAGVKVAELDSHSIEENLEELRTRLYELVDIYKEMFESESNKVLEVEVLSDLSGVRIREEKPNGKIKTRIEKTGLFVVGAPLLGRKQYEPLREVQQFIERNQHGLRVRALTTNPQTRLEKFLYFFPWVDEGQWPTPGEWISSIISWTTSATVFGSVMFSTQPVEVAAAVWATNIFFSGITTFPRQTVGNWFMKSRTWWEKGLKQAAITAFFSLGLFLAAEMATEGLSEASSVFYSKGFFYAFLFPNLVSMTIQGLWRLPAEQLIPKWVSEKTEGERRARNYGSWYRAIATNLATAAWGYSMVTDQSLGSLVWSDSQGNDVALQDFNWGHPVQLGVLMVLGLGYVTTKVYDLPIHIVDGLSRSGSTLGAAASRPLRGLKNICRLAASCVLKSSKRRRDLDRDSSDP